MKYQKAVVLLLCLLLLAGCAAKTPAPQPAPAPQEAPAESVPSPYLQSQGVTEEEHQGNTSTPKISADTLLRECALLLEGEITAVNGSAVTFTAVASYKGEIAEKTLTVTLRDSDGLTPKTGSCILALQQEKGTYYLSHGAASWLPADGVVFTNTLSGADKISLDPTALPGEIALLTE